MGKKSLKDISKWIRQTLWEIGNPMGQLDLGVVGNKLEALHFCGMMWRRNSSTEANEMEVVDVDYQKTPPYNQTYRWIPIVSTPIVNHDKLTELVIFNLIDRNEHRKRETRDTLARQWSMAALRFFSLQGVLLPHPKALLRRKSVLDIPDVWEPTDSLWKLLRQMSCAAADWDRLLRRIPCHVIPTEVWSAHGLIPTSNEDYSNLLAETADVGTIFNDVALKFDAAFAAVSQQKARSSTLAGAINDLERSCRHCSIVAARCRSSEDPAWRDAAPDFLERLAHASRPLMIRKQRSHSNSNSSSRCNSPDGQQLLSPSGVPEHTGFPSSPSGDPGDVDGTDELTRIMGTPEADEDFEPATMSPNAPLSPNSHNAATSEKVDSVNSSSTSRL